MNKTTDTDGNYCFYHKDYKYCINGGRLIISREEKGIISLNIAPVIEGKQTDIKSWEKYGENQWKGLVDGFGSVIVEIKNGYPCILFKTDSVWFDEITYFSSAEFSGKRWATYASDDLDKIWELDDDVNVPVSSCYADVFHPDGHDGSGPMDPGDNPPLFNWNMHVRAAAVETYCGWLGLAVPGPLPVGVTRFKTENRQFSLTFEALRTTCRDWGMPEVYIVTGLSDRDELLNIYREISDSMGVTVEKQADHPAWWANPVFDSWEEICRLLKLGTLNEADPSSGEEYLQSIPAPDYSRADEIITIENNRKWLKSIQDTTGIKPINTTFEQGCFRLYGDYRPIDGLGGTVGLRNLIDEWRMEGIHTAYYIHPFIVNKKVKFYQEHPEAFCRQKDNNLKMAYALEFFDRKPEYALVDWTHPLGRQFMLDTVRFMLSEEPGCLNCDILRSNHWRGPDPRHFDFFDPDWGIGDLMSMKVQKLLYQEAKKIKPHAMVSKVGFADPYMQPYADMDYLSEEWSHNTDNWHRRARIATRTIRNCIFLVDPFVATLTKITETFSSFLAYSVPATTMIAHALHPQMFYRKMRDIDYRRRKAGFNVYINAPINVTDISGVNWKEDNREAEVWRKYTRGPLAGWYAAKAFGKKCFVTYSDKEARIAACINKHINVEIPPGYKVESVSAITHEEKEIAWEHCIKTLEGIYYVDMYVKDCGKDFMYYRITYKLNNS